MKGVVFTELCEMVEEKFGIEVLNRLVDECDLPSGGAYSAVDNYDSSELFQLVTKLSEISNIPAQDLIHTYGLTFFDVLFSNYSAFFERASAFEFLKSIDSHIHVEVKKLYPEAELPKFSYKESEGELKLIYTSERKLYKFARGLIDRTIQFFDEKISVTENLINEDGSHVEFLLSKEL